MVRGMISVQPISWPARAAWSRIPPDGSTATTSSMRPVGGVEANFLRIVVATILLGAYALGLGIPFFLSAVALNWFLAGSARVRRWIRPIEIGAGLMLLLVGVMLFTGHFAVITSFLSSYAPPIEVGL